MTLHQDVQVRFTTARAVAFAGVSHAHAKTVGKGHGQIKLAGLKGRQKRPGWDNGYLLPPGDVDALALAIFVIEPSSWGQIPAIPTSVP